MFINGNYKIYIVTLPNGKKVKFWFAGKPIEYILKAYNIPYIKENKKNGGVLK